LLLLEPQLLVQLLSLQASPEPLLVTSSQLQLFSQKALLNVSNTHKLQSELPLCLAELKLLAGQLLMLSLLLAKLLPGLQLLLFSVTSAVAAAEVATVASYADDIATAAGGELLSQAELLLLLLGGGGGESPG
jgi:hypothetical protein